MRKITWLLLSSFLLLASFHVVSAAFETPFAEANIDLISFIAGGFLVLEGINKILKFRADKAALMFCRLFRIFIGVNVLIIHTVESIWGAYSPEKFSHFLGNVIDLAAFVYGAFLMIEGMIRIISSESRTRPAVPADQLTRAIRVMIGSSIFTIHLLQFMRG